MSIGLILGPVLGGVIYARCGYYAAFGLAFGFIGVDLMLRVILVEKKIAARYIAAPSNSNEEPRSIKMQDLPNMVRPDDSEAIPQTDPTPSSVLMIRRLKMPTVIRILRYPRLLVALFLSFVQALVFSAFDATIPLYLNALFNYSALQSGSLHLWPN